MIPYNRRLSRIATKAAKLYLWSSVHDDGEAGYYYGILTDAGLTGPEIDLLVKKITPQLLVDGANPNLDVIPAMLDHKKLPDGRYRELADELERIICKS